MTHIVGIGSIRLSNDIILNFVFQVLSLTCNPSSVSKFQMIIIVLLTVSLSCQLQDLLAERTIGNASTTMDFITLKLLRRKVFQLKCLMLLLPLFLVLGKYCYDIIGYAIIIFIFEVIVSFIIQ